MIKGVIDDSSDGDTRYVALAIADTDADSNGKEFLHYAQNTK